MFEEEYVLLVIKPKIDMILVDGVGSIGELTSRFNEAFSCKVSKSRITQWLKALGYRVTRTVQIEGPARMNAPAPAPAREVAQVGEPVFNTAHRQQMMDIPSPAGVFSNVQMPGFQE